MNKRKRIQELETELKRQRKASEPAKTLDDWYKECEEHPEKVEEWYNPNRTRPL